MKFDFPVVHAVTDSAALQRPDFLHRAEAIMRALGARGAVHLRTSRLSGRRFHEIAASLAALQATTGCWLIVNDRVDIGRAVGARGIQLASHSLGIAEARVVAPDTPIGASIHSVEEARQAESEGASWCVAGTVFETPSHLGREPARLGFIEDVTSILRIPVIAIGGIEPADVAALRKAGAHGIATIRGAGWEGARTAVAEDDPLRHTRLFEVPGTASEESVTRYISAYDSDSGSGRNDHPDGERSSEGAGA